MGYTHYWTQTRDFTLEEMGDIAASAWRIIAEADCDVCGPHGDEGTPPMLTKTTVSLNGRDEHAHETFHFEATRQEPYAGGEPGWSCCKTACKPYDVVVTACLTFLSVDYGFEVSSDGEVEDWEAGVALAEQALGRKFANPMIVNALVA
ncbi:MAG: hypothetical protein M3R04_08485 [bacterium]|nr:hypothetical protein [bacterium]